MNGDFVAEAAGDFVFKWEVNNDWAIGKFCLRIVEAENDPFCPRVCYSNCKTTDR